jgi:sigma-B regulation protein RsbU (phosphoserine phosphatase)
MDSNKELINLTSLLDFSNKLTQNLSEEFILNSTLLTILGKLGICGIVANKLIDNEPQKSYKKGLFDCEPSFCGSIRLSQGIEFEFILGQKLTKTEISEAEEQYVKLILSIATTALENSINFNNLQTQKTKAEKKSQLLETLFEISRSFSDYSSEEKILKALAFNVMGQLATNKFAVVKTGSTISVAVNQLGISDEELISIATALDKVNLDIDLDKPYRDLIKIASPMTIGGKVEGFILIGPKMVGEYDEQDYQFVSSLASTTIVALENERLIQEEIEKKRFETEISLASNIQKRLLPKNSLETDSFSLYGMTMPSNEVGGDYFDYIKVSESKYLFVIADVTGKGMPAALIMSNIQAIIQSLAPIEKDLNSLVNAVNRIVYKSTSKDMFITAFFCLLDTETNELKYINAGHFYPLLATGSTLKELDKGGVILGFLPSPLRYESETLPFEGTLYMYTDGFNEAKDSEDNELGMDGVKKIVSEANKLDAKEATEYILAETKRFSNSEHLADDISIVVLKKK